MPSSQDGAVPPRSARRRLLTYGVGAAAGAIGAGWAWWRLQPHAGADAAAEAAFFGHNFVTHEGATVSAAAFRGRPLLLNFWATWCPPCIAELPLLNEFFRQHKASGWQVLGLAVDQPDAVGKFLQRSPVDFPSVMAGPGGTELSRSLGNLAGGLPFTVVFSSAGRIVHRKMGQIKPPDLQAWVQKNR